MKTNMTSVRTLTAKFLADSLKRYCLCAMGVAAVGFTTTQSFAATQDGNDFYRAGEGEVAVQLFGRGENNNKGIIVITGRPAELMFEFMYNTKESAVDGSPLKTGTNIQCTKNDLEAICFVHLDDYSTGTFENLKKDK